MSLRLDSIAVELPAFRLDADVELNAHVTAVFGPSGAGKTTLLDVIAGLRKPSAGRVILHDRVLTDVSRRTFVPPHLRRVGYVPQDLALFPHLTVRENLLFGFRGPDPAGALEGVTGILELRGLEDRRIRQLSGGEKQRVALGRALLTEPRLLLLDEPLASLDAALKDRILPCLRRIRDAFDIPILHVSHDAREVRLLCDEVLILEAGRIVRRGPPSRMLPGPSAGEPDDANRGA